MSPVDAKQNWAENRALYALVAFGVIGLCLRTVFAETPVLAPVAAPRHPDPAPAVGPRLLHPVTPAHERIYRENNLVDALNGAMDARDAAGLRGLLARYRKDYPEDALGLRAGFELIATCLERPGAETEAAARRYYETETGSTLRRHVRRHCLTPERTR